MRGTSAAKRARLGRQIAWPVSLAVRTRAPDNFADWLPLLSELMNHEYLLQSENPRDRPGCEILKWHNSEVYLG